MEINPVVIGQLVRQKRIERNIGARELARGIGVSAGYITQLEKGVYKKPSQTVLIRLFELLKFENKYKNIFGLSEMSEKELNAKINCEELKKMYVANLTAQAENMEADDLRKLTVFLENYRDIFIKICEIDEKTHEKGKVIHSIREFVDFTHNKNVVNRLDKLFE
ncbi:helix-turn-helix domain-containing protein [Neobacillus mesonae]|uniref:helix-turn-helix domain-containing protein n=1 Tax=Neobacillus mesonae TaxID=1193713 RepID=UPI000834684D|nr:helix-turn-helix transcriptional regulator [Neobacillus mesonae]